MYPTMFSDIGSQVFIFACLAVFTGGIAACISWAFDHEKRREIRIGALIALVLVSLAAFFFLPDKPNIPGIIVYFIAILWFPAAIVLSSQIVPGISTTRSLPYWILTVSVMVYMIEFFFGAYVGPILAFRSSHVLILMPSPPLPYAWMQIPGGYQAIIQCFITFLLADFIFWLGLRLGRTRSNTGKFS